MQRRFLVEGWAPPPWYGGHFFSNLLAILAILLCTLLVIFIIFSLARCAHLYWVAGGGVDIPANILNGIRRTNAALQGMAVIEYHIDGGERNIPANSECPICLAEFDDGERVRVLPACCHVFHVRCVDAWLVAQPSCPVCRHLLLAADCGGADSS